MPSEDLNPETVASLTDESDKVDGTSEKNKDTESVNSKIGQENDTSEKVEESGSVNSKIAQENSTSEKVEESGSVNSKIAQENDTIEKVEESGSVTSKITQENDITEKVQDSESVNSKIAQENDTSEKVEESELVESKIVRENDNAADSESNKFDESQPEQLTVKKLDDVGSTGPTESLGNEEEKSQTSQNQSHDRSKERLSDIPEEDEPTTEQEEKNPSEIAEEDRSVSESKGKEPSITTETEEYDERKRRVSVSVTEMEKLMKGEDEDEMSFSLLEIQDEPPPPVEEVPEEPPEERPRKRRRSTKRVIDRLSMSIAGSEYSSLHFSGIESMSRITGDFKPLGSNKSPLITHSANDTESEDEEYEEYEEELTEDDRIEYYNTYDILDKQHEEEKAKNIYLQKKLCNYYQKRRMFHVLHDGRVQMDSQKKYEKQLDEFEQLAHICAREEQLMNEEINELRERCAIRQRQAKECFERLQRDEYEVGKEIVSSEVGKGHEEKLLERYLKRQKIQLSNIMKIRLDFIKIRNRFNEKQETLNALDNLGPDLHLIDYEQLKLDNRNLQDKLEEKELELTRVRAKCQNAVQILAHRREKTAALDVDITHLQERLEGVEGEYEDVREQLNALKQERDAYRSAIAKMKIKSGLLSRPTLLRDMCHKIKEIETLSDHLFDLRCECLDTMKKVNRLKKNMSSETTLKRIKEIMTGIEESVKSLSISEIESENESVAT
jgi:hypothetical protein